MGRLLDILENMGEVGRVNPYFNGDELTHNHDPWDEPPSNNRHFPTISQLFSNDNHDIRVAGLGFPHFFRMK